MRPCRNTFIKRHALLAMLALVANSPAQEFLDRLDEALLLQNESGSLRVDVSVLSDIEVYVAETPAPGLLFQEDDAFVNPRLAVFLDIHATDYLQLHSQMRVDRGFDPGSRAQGEVRLDEYYARLRPFGDDRLNFQVGKFATAFGGWTPRHLSWENPFINAPLAYEDVLPITDHTAPPDARAFLNRQNIADKKREWLPLLWGPSYAAGASVFGRVDWFEYAFEIKNTGISSRPYAWDYTRHDLDNPTFTGRLGARPSPEWSFGTSFSRGSYMLHVPPGTLPRGKEVDDYAQTTFGFDAAYQHHHLQLWGEAIFSRFEVPNAGDADVFSYFLEAKYKLTAQTWLALRWNQQFYGDVPDGRGGEAAWDRDAWRAELALGHRFTEHLQGKLQYSVGDKSGNDPEGDHLFAAQVTVRF
jgi:hypothetical protein